MPPIQTALVTGATSGIGYALCHLLASKGIHLIVSGRNSEQLEVLKKELGETVNVVTQCADLATEQGRESVIKLIEQYTPELVVNNAGFGLYGEVLKHSAKDNIEILKVNGEAVLEITLAAASCLKRASKKGTIVNVSSVAAFFPFPYLSIYAASKAFINSLSESLYFELEPYGIRVLAACPGQVATKFSSRASGKENQEVRKRAFGGMSADFAAHQIWKQIVQGKRMHVFDWKYRFSVFLANHILPRKWLSALLGQRIKARIL